MRLKVEKPDGTETTYTYPTDNPATLERVTTGDYRKYLTPAPTEWGTWTVRWEGEIDGKVAVDEDSFQVQASRFAAGLVPYATLDELTAILDGTTAGDAAGLGLALEGASAFITRETRRRFDEYVATKTYDTVMGTRAHVLDLQAATSVELAPYTSAAFVALTSADYYLGPAERDYGEPYRWIDLSPYADYPEYAKGYRTLRIAGAWGWAQVPADIKLVCIQMAVRWWRAAKAGFVEAADVPDLGRLKFDAKPTEYERLVLAGYKPGRAFVFA